MSFDKPDSNGAVPQNDAAQKFRDQLYSKPETRQTDKDGLDHGGIPIHGRGPSPGDYLPKPPQTPHPDLPPIIIIDVHDKAKHPNLPTHERK